METRLTSEEQQVFRQTAKVGYGDVVVSEEYWDIKQLLTAQLAKCAKTHEQLVQQGRKQIIKKIRSCSHATDEDGIPVEPLVLLVPESLLKELEQ